MKLKYTDEKNIQMLIYLLKKNNIRKVIINPGTMNMSFVVSIQNDDFFQLYSCVDERSACYMACGLATESLEPVVLTCTGATASRNYMPGLTEAYYRKLPILAITATPHLGRIGHNIPQVIDRTTLPNDIAKLSVHIQSVHCEEDLWDCNIKLNRAILELKHKGAGPVHVNLGTTLTKKFDVSELPEYRLISRFSIFDDLPNINSQYKKIAIFVGSHNLIDKKLENEMDEFCEKYNSFVLCDNTSNYFGKYKVLGNLIYNQMNKENFNLDIDLLVHIGDISPAYMDIRCKEVWRVNPDGMIRDTFNKLTNVFEMPEINFFKYYNSLLSKKVETTLYSNWNSYFEMLEKMLNNTEIPFSNLWVAKNTVNRIAENSTVYLAILNTVRSWNYYKNNNKFAIYTNSGGFGIDGIMSSTLGASLNNEKKNYYCIIGDLAFFYDMNSLGNRHVRSNLRIMLINNGCGTEFHNYSHPANILGDDAISNYIGADGHYGNKSEKLVKEYVTALGFDYISASNKEEFEEHISKFVAPNLLDKPMVFEVFTSSILESEALKLVNTLNNNEIFEIKNNIKKNIKGIIPKSVKDGIKKIAGKK